MFAKHFSKPDKQILPFEYTVDTKSLWEDVDKNNCPVTQQAIGLSQSLAWRSCSFEQIVLHFRQ